MKTAAYDIFISYRRETGADTAKHLRDVLTEKGYRVFFDTDSLRSGSFNLELVEVIRNCKDFIILLTEKSLDRCVNEDDWVRQELIWALNTGKNIIPVMSGQFRFPDELPEEISGLRQKNGITLNVEYFNAAVSRLLSMLQSRPRRKTARWLPAVIAGLVCVAAAVAIMAAVRPSGKTNENEKEIVLSADSLALLTRLGYAAYNSGDYSTALENLLPAADQGYLIAQNLVAAMYFNGEGVEQSYEKAAEYYLMSANQSYIYSQEAVGLMYLGGLGLDQSDEKALEYLMPAAEQGSPLALYYLGYMYELGLGVEPSQEKALEYYRAAAEKGSEEAQAVMDEREKNNHGASDEDNGL